MGLFLSLLPLYLLGNLHCMGMCGPLVMLLGEQRYRYFYFVGRSLSFTLAGFIAGALGEVISAWLHLVHLSALFCFVIGGVILWMGFSVFWGWALPGGKWLSSWSQKLSPLLLKEDPWRVFLFGFFTVFLPCGQTVIVFSACAMAGDAWVGLLNGFMFAILTSPSLWLAMRAKRLFGFARSYYRPLMGSGACVIGLLAICRGLADLGWIPHLTLAPSIVLF